MPIFADITEERHLVRYEDKMTFVVGIEALTGADLIISPLSIPTTNDALILRHARVGLCVQRKDIGDFVASITNEDNRLWTQLARLRKVTDLPWLLVIGDLKCNKDGFAVIDGRESGWTYSKIIAAMDWWQIRGGYMSWIGRDGLFLPWCQMWLSRLEQKEKDSNNGWGQKIIYRPIPQTLYEIDPIVRTLMTMPGIGEDRAVAVYEFAASKTDGKPTLMDVMLVLQDEKVEGVGKKTRDKVMDYIGWPDS